MKQESTAKKCKEGGDDQEESSYEDNMVFICLCHALAGQFTFG
jgi:hypothetical protein